MEFLVPVALFGWLPIVLILYRELRGHRGVVAAYVTAWLFLPAARYQFSGLPDYTKVTATTLGITLAVMLFDGRRILTFRPRWFDGFMAVFCLCPIATSLANQLGLWDGLSSSLKSVLGWGLPYFFGRLFFDSFDKLRSLAKGIFIGGLVYVPFCLIEMRMSPQFYLWVYGFRPRRFNAWRYGGWRPNVFLEEGLELGMWMTAASLLGVALWQSGAWKRLAAVPVGIWLSVLLVTTVLCRATTALLLLVGGLGVLLMMRLGHRAWPAVLLACLPVLYVSARATHLYEGQEIVQLAAQVFGEDRARSLQFRFQNEKALAERAWQSPLVGWGGWGRSRVPDEFGESQAIIDGIWIGVFGERGLVGLISLMSAFLVCPTIACCRFVRAKWPFSQTAPTIAIAILLLLYMADCLLNAMDNPIYCLCLGAVSTVCLRPFSLLVESPHDSAPDAQWKPPPARALWPQRPPPKLPQKSQATP